MQWEALNSARSGRKQQYWVEHVPWPDATGAQDSRPRRGFAQQVLSVRFLLLAWTESRHNAQRCYSFTPADPACSIVARHFDVDMRRAEPKKMCESFLHRSLIPLQSWPLGNNRDVRRKNSQPADPPVRHHSFQQYCAVDSDKLLV